MAGFTTRPEIQGTFGVVTSTHWLGTAAGMAVLEKGGNAFDAACAVGFALQVVEPHLVGPLGDVPMIVAPAKGRVQVICGQGPAPAAASIDAFKALGLDLVPGTGLLAAVVPGAFDAWMLLLRDFGTLKLRDVLSYAIGYAAEGYPLYKGLCDNIASVRDLYLSEWKTSAAVYLPGGAVPLPGTLLRNPGLAATYQRVLKEAEAAGSDRVRQIEAARRAWYKGFVAEIVERFCRETEVMDSSGRRHRGLLTADDMARWQATVEEPATYDYGRYRVCKTGPWGQGPVFLQQLALLKGFDLGAMGSEDPTFIHTVAECAKLAFADREAYYGDPDFVDVPLDHLLGDAYNDARRTLVGERASLDLRPGTVPGFTPRLVSRRKGDSKAAAGIGEPSATKLQPSRAGLRASDTVHLDVIDRFGNIISATPSGGWIPSSPVIPELGFPLGTRAQMFWLEEGLPASLAPGKRPRTTLTPSLGLRDGEPYMAFGTAGGDRQDQWTLALFLRHVHFGLNLQEAIDAVGFHTDHFPSSFYPREYDPGHLSVESRIDGSAVEALRRRGHAVVVEEPWSLGRLAAAAKDGRLLKAGATPRFMQAYAMGR